MRIVNFGCIGPEGLTIQLDNIVCLVGANNVGKSTVLRAYEAAADTLPLTSDEIHHNAGEAGATVELWVHIPQGTPNIAEKWIEEDGPLRMIRARWVWGRTGGPPVRGTWDPELGDYSTEFNASGVDAVFSSRLPRPFRIGSLEDPTEEHSHLLKLVLEPITSKLKEMKADRESPLAQSLRAVYERAAEPVAEFREQIKVVEARVNRSYQRVFRTGAIKVDIQLGEVAFNPEKSLLEASTVNIEEGTGEQARAVRWRLQGTGSQRALFWSMLEVRSELRRQADQKSAEAKRRQELEKKIKKAESDRDKAKEPSKRERYQAALDQLQEELAGRETNEGEGVNLPGYMLLIDEPETALHPGAVRAAKAHLYSLARDAGWQVMLSTHHPAFVDPLEDHTTIVRMHRDSTTATPNTYRSDDAAFEGTEKECLRQFLAFDLTLAEMFFGSHPIIVEGDTEYAAFVEVMRHMPEEFPVESRPLILRAGGKATMPLIIRMLAQFRMNMTVLHDIDAPNLKSDSSKRNPAFGANGSIVMAVEEARAAGVKVRHRCSCPEFERQHGFEPAKKDKPFRVWKTIESDEAKRDAIASLLRELAAGYSGNERADPQDGRHFDLALRNWITTNRPEGPEFEIAEDYGLPARASS